MVPSTVDPDATGQGEKANKGPKKGVRISAWKLAKLDSNDAMKAAAKARALSSVLRPLDGRRLPDSEISSSDNGSIRSSMSTDTGGNKDARNDLRLSPMRHSFAPSQGSRDEYETGTQTASSFSSPSHVHESVSLSPLPQARGLIPDQPIMTSRAAGPGRNNPVFPNATGFDEKIMQRHSGSDPLIHSAPIAQPNSFVRDVKRTSVVWDQEAGRYVSVPVSATDARKRPVVLTGNQEKRPAVPPRELPPPPVSKPAVRESEKMLYTGESIFFGGPLLSAPMRGEGSSNSRDGQDKVVTMNSRLKRDAVSNQLPIFIPGDFELNPPSGSSLK